MPMSCVQLCHYAKKSKHIKPSKRTISLVCWDTWLHAQITCSQWLFGAVATDCEPVYNNNLCQLVTFINWNLGYSSIVRITYTVASSHIFVIPLLISCDMVTGRMKSRTASDALHHSSWCAKFPDSSIDFSQLYHFPHLFWNPTFLD